MSLVRVPVTLAAAMAFHVAMSPPSETDSHQDCDRRAVCATARFMTVVFTKGLFWASALTDAFVVLAPHVRALHHTGSAGLISIPSAGTLLAFIKQPTRWGPSLALPLSLPPLPPLPLLAVAGTTLALAGAYLRYAAYRALGQFYACPNRGLGPCVPRGAGRARAKNPRGHAHALITTGPYAIVRHPGYAGLVLCTTGLVLLELDAVSRTSVVGMSAGMRTVALMCAVLAAAGAFRRVRDEENSLRARFKGEWEAWAKKVPCKLVPGVY